MASLETKAGEQIYVDVTTGQHLYGEMAIEVHINAGGHPADLYPLSEALDNKSIPLAENFSANSSTREELLETGKFLLKVMDLGNTARALRTHIVRRGHKLGFMPGDEYIASPEMYGSLRGWQAELGVDNIDKRHRFDHYELDDIIDHLENVVAEEGQKPTRDVLWRRIRRDKRDEITPKAIDRRILVSAALEYLGFPDINSFSNERLEEWGVDFTLANERLPDRVRLSELSKAGRGPSPSFAVLRYGKMRTYKDQVQARLEREVAGIENGIASGELDPGLFANATSLLDIVTIYRLYEVVAELCPAGTASDRMLLTSAGFKGEAFVKAIKLRNRSIGRARVESVARKHGAFPIIFVRGDYWAQLRGSNTRKAHRDYERYEKRKLRQVPEVEQRYFDGVEIIEQVIQDDGFVFRKLAGTRPDLALEPDSDEARAVINRIRKSIRASAGSRSYSIPGSRGVAKPKD